MIDEINADMKPGDKWPTVGQPRANRIEVGKIEQLTNIPGQPATFFDEPMVGITVKQHEEYLALRARAAEICTWTHDPEECDGYYETSCEQQFQWPGEGTSDLKFCYNCGRKVEVK